MNTGQHNASYRVGHMEFLWTQHDMWWERWLLRPAVALGLHWWPRHPHPYHQAADMPSIPPWQSLLQAAALASGSWAVNNINIITNCASHTYIYVHTRTLIELGSAGSPFTLKDDHYQLPFVTSTGNNPILFPSNKSSQEKTSLFMLVHRYLCIHYTLIKWRLDRILQINIINMAK